MTELPRATWGGTGAARQPRAVVLAVGMAAAALGTAASPAAAHGDELLVRGSLWWRAWWRTDRSGYGCTTS
jgi:hypothetical protein